MRKNIMSSNKSYYKRILIFMFTFVLVAVLPFTLLLYKRTQKNMLDNINQSNEQVLNQMSFNYSYFTEAISTQCRSTFLRYEVQGLLYNHDIDATQNIQIMKNLRDDVLSATPSLNSIEIYNAIRNELYSTEIFHNTNAERISEFVNEHDTVPKLRPILRRIQENNGQVTTTQYVFSYYMFDYGNPLSGAGSYIVFNQDAGWFIHNLAGAMSQRVPAMVYLANDSGEIFNYQGTENISEKDLVQSFQVDQILEKDQEKGFLITTLNGSRYLISYINLQDQTNYLIMVQAYNDVFASQIKMRNEFFLMSVLFVVVGSVMIILLSKRIYRPMDSLVDYISNLEGQEDSLAKRGDEFQQLRRLYEKTHDTKKELLQERSLFKDNLRTYFCSLLLEDSTAANWAKYTGSLPEAEAQKAKGGNLIVAVLYVDHLRNNQFVLDYHFDLLAFCMSNVLHELIEECLVEFINKEPGSFVVLIDCGDRNVETGFIQEKIYYLQEFMSSYFKVTISAAISSEGHDFTQLSDLYYEAQHYASYRMIYGPNVLLNEAICRDNIENTQTSYSRELSKHLKESLKLGNVEQVRVTLSKIKDAISQLSQDNILINLMTLVTEVNAAMNEINFSKQLTSSVHFDSIYKTALEVEFLSRFFEDLFTCLEGYVLDNQQDVAKKEDKDQIFVQRIINYVNKNYGDANLTSQQIADYLNMSVRYLMNKFKQCTGITLNEYILDTRMKEATRLLLQTNMPVNKIAEYIGIGNENYFYRLFKKSYGCTPREFSQRVKE